MPGKRKSRTSTENTTKKDIESLQKSRIERDVKKHNVDNIKKNIKSLEKRIDNFSFSKEGRTKKSLENELKSEKSFLKSAKKDNSVRTPGASEAYSKARKKYRGK
jgi:flagellar motility protein MotE (MotC chaperone)